MVMIDRPEDFEYCSVNHSPLLLDHYKSIYKHDTVPMIVEIDISTSQERFIGGYTDLIKHFKEKDIKRKVLSSNGEN